MKWLLLLVLTTPALAQSTQEAMQHHTHNCMVYYPPSAVRSHAEGVTTLAFQVTAAGAVTNVTIEKSSGHPSLDDASVKCVQEWQYTPTTNNGSPGSPAGTRQVNIAWRLDDGASSLLFEVESAALDCIRRANPAGEARVKAAKDTVVQIQFNKKRYSFPFSEGGTSVELISSSGNGDLDNLVIGCLKHLPPNLRVDTSVTLDFVTPFSWKTETQAKTASVPPAESK